MARIGQKEFVMRIFKFLLLALIVFNLTCDATAQVKKNKIVKKGETKIVKAGEKMKSFDAADIKYIAEGAYSKVEKPFVFVARTPETYEQLQDLVENLSPVSGIDFQKTAVVAAFAGTKKSGGYSVEIKKSANKITLGVIEPPKDAMTTQALTMPFAVALVPVEAEMPLVLDVSPNLKAAAQIYKVAKGKFEYSGGFAGRLARFDAEGTIGVFSFGNYATLVFNLSGKAAEKARKLSETASGTLIKGKINLARLDAGSFSEGPKPPVSVAGTLTNGKLVLTFEPLRTNVADGFEVRGRIDAVKIK